MWIVTHLFHSKYKTGNFGYLPFILLFIILHPIYHPLSDNYKIIRETMLGVLQATDLALVKKTTISRVSEELMLSTPKYWLAPCLVTVAGLGILLLIGAGVLAVLPVKAKKTTAEKIEAIEQSYASRIISGKEKINQTTQQWKNAKNVVYQFESKPVREIIA